MAMLQIGPVQFKTTGPHYEALKHQAEICWPKQGRFGRRDARQYTGEGDETITVQGTIYTDYFGGFSALDRLRAIARVPHLVISGGGDVFGRYCIVNVGNEQTYQDARGAPRKVTFEVKLERYGEDGAGFGFSLF